MLEYLVIGLVSGGIYALASSGLVVTYSLSGILNFAYGAMAFFIARLFYFLNTQHGWSTWQAATLSIVVVAPALGVTLWWLLFRHLQRVSVQIKIVATVGLSVALPELVNLLLGNPSAFAVPGLAPHPVPYYRVDGVVITLDQIIIAVTVVAVLAIGLAISRFTRWGLAARGMVDSPALTALSGINPNAVAGVVWAVTTLLAGLVGVLIGPIIGLDPVSYTGLMAICMSAVVLARFSHVGLAVLFGLLFGIVTSLLEDWLPPNSWISAGILDAIPFAFLLVFLAWSAIRGDVSGGVQLAGQLDRAILPAGERRSSREESQMSEGAARLHDISGRRIWNKRSFGGVVPLMLAAILPSVVGPYWLTLIGEGFCFACIFLSFTLVTGEGGMMWLCLVSFAGLGAVFTGYLISTEHWPAAVAWLAAGIAVAPLGLLLGLLTTRPFGVLYIAVVTLAFGILMDNVVFPLNIFSHGDLNTGVLVARPGWADNQTVLTYVVFGIFCVLSLGVEHFRRSTAGLGVTAVRWSEAAAKSVGLGIVQVRILLTVVAAFIAAFGGGLLAVFIGQAVPGSFNSLGGLVWLAVVVSVGAQTSVGALVAGLSFSLARGLVVTYLPTAWAPIPTVLFGLGAVMLVRNPEGALAQHVRYVREIAKTSSEGNT